MVFGKTFAVRGNIRTTIRSGKSMEFERVSIKFVDLGPKG